MKKTTYEDIINRIGYFRNEAKLSGRETSMRLGYNPQFMKTIENKSVELKVKTLLDFCEVVGISIQEFFYFGNEYSNQDLIFLKEFSNLSHDNKKTIVDLIYKLK